MITELKSVPGSQAPGCLARQFFGIFFACLAWAGAALASDALPEPTGPVILTVEGKIGRTNIGDTAQFDAAMLKALGQDEVVTETPWTDGMRTFGGIKLSTILSAVDARGTELFAAAENDYTVVIPVEDAQSYPVILATSIDGKELSLRDRGPLWVIYPFADYDELRTDAYITRSIWMLTSLKVE